ncbi:MAG: flagellar biosynthetic protein FliR [Lachnospiraceae bacterium]|nr:flagellar biosynthetic protein FliR [Lachnospiraceae bacterium]
MVDYSFSLEVFEHFLLVLVRIVSFVAVAPFFSIRGIPNMTKAGFAAVLSIMVLLVKEPAELSYVSVIGYAVAVIKELLVGLLLGFCTYICNSIILLAGNLIDMDIGLSMVSEFDPTMNTQITVTGNLYFYFYMTILLAINGHQFLMRALCDSFDVIPLGGAIFDMNDLFESIVLFFTNLFVLAFRIMLPVFAAMLILNVVLGVMAKVAPQMNMFAVGVQIKIITGFVILMAMIILFPQVVTIVADQMKINLRSITEGLL